MDLNVKHSEYAKIYGISTQQAAREIRKACLSLPDNSYFQLRADWDGNVLSELDNKIFTKSELSELTAFKKGNIVQDCSFGIRRGESEITFTKSFIAHALPVKDYFTQYRLYQADSLTNENHIGLYEELQRWFDIKSNSGLYITTPNRLINKLLLPSTYEKYAQMRRGFIDPALKNINKNTNLHVDLVEERVDPTKPKSKIKRLLFNITEKKAVIDKAL